MTLPDYFAFIVNEVHTTILATVDEAGCPYTAAVDMMDCDETGLYFLTAKGKSLYTRLKQNPHVALTALAGETTMTSRACSVRGEVTELGPERLPHLFEKNPYMADIYPTEASRKVLTVFKIAKGTGEWFDLSRLPIERADFAFGMAVRHEGYRVTDACRGCEACAEICPQGCISMDGGKAVIHAESCIHCGGCFSECVYSAIVRI